MKGIVFTEFLDLVAQQFGDDMVDDVIADAGLPHGGAYTTVGTYPFAELAALLTALVTRSGQSADALLYAFGRHLFGRFAVLYPQFIDAAASSLTLLAGIEQEIHSEVRKLYPDAELPRFVVEEQDAQHLILLYQSPRSLATLARGLIDGARTHYGESDSVSLRQEALDDSGQQVRFILEKA